MLFLLDEDGSFLLAMIMCHGLIDHIQDFMNTAVCTTIPKRSEVQLQFNISTSQDGGSAQKQARPHTR